MDKSLVVETPIAPRVRLRAVGPEDLEDLRTWKNANKQWFFFKGDITPGMQKEWYESYLERADDLLFIVEHAGGKAGAMGFRILDNGSADVYNVVAAPGAAGRGLMKAAMILLCSRIAATRTKDIGCLVLKGNPAAAYYGRCGFVRTGGEPIHDIFTLDWPRFEPVAFTES